MDQQSTLGLFRIVGFALALVGWLPAQGCGDGFAACESSGAQELAVTLSPEVVVAGTEVTVVASFERSVFDDGDFYVQSERVAVVDPETDQWIGTFDASRYRESVGNDALVSGVVVAGEVIDDRSIELTLELPNQLPAGVVIAMGAGNDDPHCDESVFGTAELRVDLDAVE